MKWNNYNGVAGESVRCWAAMPKIGAQHITDTGNPPKICSIATTYPCFRTVIQQIAYHSAPTITTKSLRQMMIDRLPDPKVALESPSTDWRWIWKNVSCFKLSSHQRSMLYLLVHNKVPHGFLLDRTNRASTACSFCSRIVTLEHRFAMC